MNDKRKSSKKLTGVPPGTFPAAERLRAYREGRGTRLHVAALAGINITTLAIAELGGPITRRTAEKLAPVLGVKVEDILP